jgi:hypothetical protein
MSVAQGQEVLDDGPADDADAWASPDPASPDGPEAAPAASTALLVPAGSAADVPPESATSALAPGAVLPRRTVLPPRPPVPSSPAAWARAVRVASLPLTLLGAAVGGLLVARDVGVRPGLLALAVGGLVAAHALGGLVRDLGDARPDRAGPLRRVEAGRAALGLTGAGVLVLGLLGGMRDLRVAGFAALGCLAVLLAVSRRSGLLLTVVAGHLAGVVAVGTAVWAATGVVGGGTLLVGLAVGGPLSALLAARRTAVGGVPARGLVVAPYVAAGAAVAVSALPLPALAVGLALPAARRASLAARGPDATAVVAGHARLYALLLVGGLLAAALTGLDLPLG